VTQLSTWLRGATGNPDALYASSVINSTNKTNNTSLPRLGSRSAAWLRLASVVFVVFGFSESALRTGRSSAQIRLRFCSSLFTTLYKRNRWPCGSAMGTRQAQEQVRMSRQFRRSFSGALVRKPGRLGRPDRHGNGPAKAAIADNPVRSRSHDLKLHHLRRLPAPQPADGCQGIGRLTWFRSTTLPLARLARHNKHNGKRRR